MHLSRLAELLAPFLTTALAEVQLAQLAAYLEILHRWNARMNLTAVRDPEQVVTRHFGESLFAAQAVFPSSLAPRASCLIDIGSGAGFPGLPIKIWAPDLTVTLIESQNKKATFLKEVIRALDLRDILVSTTRAEDYGRNAGVSPATQLSNPVIPSGGARSATQSRAPVFSAATVTLRAVEKFDRILPVAVRLAHGGRLALLIGSAQVSTALTLASTFHWADPRPIPQSESRVLLMGHEPH